VPGDFNLILLDQILENPRLRMIGCCNELNAGYAADGYARSNGVAAMVVTYSVGGLSALLIRCLPSRFFLIILPKRRAATKRPRRSFREYPSSEPLFRIGLDQANCLDISVNTIPRILRSHSVGIQRFGSAV
jgi:Thiamine pyrophosphate enzyme, N-terminal TPP binding domain